MSGLFSLTREHDWKRPRGVRFMHCTSIPIPLQHFNFYYKRTQFKQLISLKPFLPSPKSQVEPTNVIPNQPQMSSSFVILPASSRTGSQAARVLLEQGFAVRVAARNSSKLESLKSLGAETVEADLEKPETIKVALEKANALFFINPPIYDGSDMFAGSEARAKALVEALKTSSIKRVVLLSSFGGEQSEGTGNIRTVHILEEALKVLAPKIELVFLRCPFFV